ncbi:MAG TPA: glycosyl transferase, partial [Cytophagales bacterium]|nr:glycosyl transferase [Cytophagales bacterium]
MLVTVFYTYVGYGLVLFVLNKIKKIFKPKTSKLHESTFIPSVTLLIATYNEEDFIEKKIQNCLELEYPKDKLKIVFVTDGSDDRTVELISKHQGIFLMHKPERLGKISAVNRAMQYVDTAIVVFCDANTLLNKQALLKIVRHFSNAEVGGVAGEKKVIT